MVGPMQWTQQDGTSCVALASWSCRALPAQRQGVCVCVYVCVCVLMELQGRLQGQLETTPPASPAAVLLVGLVVLGTLLRLGLLALRVLLGCQIWFSSSNPQQAQRR